MSHAKRTKKDVEEAYRRGFEAGFNVRPNPFVMLLRSLWRKRQLKKLRKEWNRRYKANNGVHPAWLNPPTNPIGIVKSFTEDEHGLHAEIELKGPEDV